MPKVQDKVCCNSKLSQLPVASFHREAAVAHAYSRDHKVTWAQEWTSILDVSNVVCIAQTASAAVLLGWIDSSIYKHITQLTQLFSPSRDERYHGVKKRAFYWPRFPPIFLCDSHRANEDSTPATSSFPRLPRDVIAGERCSLRS